MYEMSNPSHVSFLEYFCQNGNTVMAVILGTALATYVVYKLIQIRKRK